MIAGCGTKEGAAASDSALNPDSDKANTEVTSDASGSTDNAVLEDMAEIKMVYMPMGSITRDLVWKWKMLSMRSPSPKSIRM